MMMEQMDSDNVVNVKIEIDPEDIVEPDDLNQDEEYQFDESFKSEESEISDCRDDISSNEGGRLDVMEGTVINFLAESSISKTRVKTGMKSGCRFKCDNCSSIFRYKSTLNYHLKSECGTKVIKGKELVEKGSGKVTCNICNKKLCSRTSLMVHMRIHTGERPFLCTFCDRSFFQKAHLNDHILKMHTAGCVICRLCNKTFRDKYQLTIHMKEHKETVTPFHCKLCGESFSTRASLSNHLVSRHKQERGRGMGYRCSMCPSVMSDLSELIAHRSKEHGVVRGGVVASGEQHVATECAECGGVYSGPRQLRAHVRRAHRASLPCPHCPRLFPSAYDLRVHSRSHTGEKPFECEYCGRGFTRKSILDVHRTLHTGQKDYVCSLCGQAFNRKSKLQVHFTEHTQETVKCQVCNKEFKCQSYLLSHMKTHGSETKCSICFRSFRTAKGLSRHTKSAHSTTTAAAAASDGAPIDVSIVKTEEESSDEDEGEEEEDEGSEDEEDEGNKIEEQGTRTTEEGDMDLDEFEKKPSVDDIPPPPSEEMPLDCRLFPEKERVQV